MKKIILCVTLLLVSMMVAAGEVTEQEALKKAQQFMQGKSFQQKTLRRAASATFADGAFYVFNADAHQGFVVVSADDRTEEILGYADEGSLDMNRLPANARVWLENYAHQIKALKSNVSLAAPHRAPGAEVVKPLLTCKWDQGYPYNDQTPEAKNNKGEMSHTYTGCVATAMAQVMYYHQWPQSKLNGLEGYTTKKEPQIYVGELETTTFDWKNMKDTYTGKETATDPSVKAVAQLMRYCGQVVAMDYSLDVSTAFLYAEYFVNYFGFSKAINQVNRYGFTNDEWLTMMYDEMVAKRPVLFSANNGSGGHQFVIDGYDGKGLFHVNWGWGGSGDGYFLMDELNPDAKSVTGGPSDNGYTFYQEAIIGLRKPADGDVASVPYFYQDSEILDADKKDVENRTYTRSAVTENFPLVKVRGWLQATGAYSPKIQRTWALYQGDECIKVYAGESYESYVIEQEMLHKQYAEDYDILLGAGLKGTYQLRQVYRFGATDTWKLPRNMSCGNILIAEITDTELNLSISEKVKDVIKVNNMTLNGDYVVNRPMTATINWTKAANSKQNETYFYLWFGGRTKALASRASFMEKGKTEDLVISFKPPKAGEFSVFVTSDEEGENVLYDYKGKVTIKDMEKQKLKPTFTCSDWKDDKLKKSTLQLSAKFENQGDYEYNDNVIFELTPVDANNKEAGEKLYVRKPLKLAAGATSEPMDVTFEEQLTNGQRYLLCIDYYSNEGNSNTYYNIATYDLFTVDTSTGITTTHTSPTTNHATYNLQGQRVNGNYRGFVIKNGKKYVVK